MLFCWAAVPNVRASDHCLACGELTATKVLMASVQCVLLISIILSSVVAINNTECLKKILQKWLKLPNVNV